MRLHGEGLHNSYCSRDIIITVILLGQSNKDEMGGTCSTHYSDKKLVTNF